MAIQVVIEGYDSLEQIGVGGMAAVYKARKVSIDKTVAIKVLFPYLASDESFTERFHREAKAAARIQHENIVNVIDFGESDGAYFIVMEYYDGSTLEDLLKARDVLPLDIAVEVLLEVCFGLESAHAQDIVHRDIKPGNIIYTRSGGIKIADFGLAKKSDSVTMITQQGKVIGTPAYMSPEQAAGRNVGPASDIFSLGVVAYELLSQRKPFGGKSYSEVLEKIQTHEPPSVANVNPLIHPDIENVIARMLEKDEAKRYSSMHDVIADLEAAMEVLQMTRDRRRLSRYIKDPDAYEAKYREKVIARCLSQGAFYMQKGQTHLDDAILQFKRILHLDPNNERARKNLERLSQQRGGQDRTVTVDVTTGVGDVKAVSPKRRDKRKRPAVKRKRPRRRAAPIAGVVAAVLVLAAGYAGWRADMFPTGNRAPEVLAPEKLNVMAGEMVEFSLRAIDAEGDPVSFRAEALPEGAQLSADGSFRWEVGYGQAGSHDLAMIADDGNAQSRVSTVIDVVPADLSIEFPQLKDARTRAGETLRQKLSATSEAGMPVTFSMDREPSGMRIDKGQLTWRVPKGAEGRYRVKLTASDGLANESQTWTINVVPSRRSATETATQTATRTKPKRGSVEWTLPENANIYLDGSLKKRNAKQISLELSPGRHTLRAELASGVTGWIQVVDIKSDKREKIKAPELSYGSLSVYFLGAVGEFQVNGKPFPQQPPFSSAPMPVGQHVVSCQFAGEDAPHEFTITVEDGKETVIEYETGQQPRVSIEG